MSYDNQHSRFNVDHYNHCQPCYEDHLDFMGEQAADVAADAAAEASEHEE